MKNKTYTCANTADKDIGEVVHLSNDGQHSLCGRDMTNTPRQVWRQRDEVDHLKACKTCWGYLLRKAAA